jgi:hypothetical protein
MTETASQATFLFTVLKHTPTRVNLVRLSAALGISVQAASMRMTRLRRKLDQSNAMVTSKDVDFLSTVLEHTEGRTDIHAVGAELGMKEGAARMRLTRLKKKFARHGPVAVGGS